MPTSRISAVLLSFAVLGTGFHSLGSAWADAPSFSAECSPADEKAKKISLHFDSIEASLFDPKEREPLWIDYDEKLGEFTMCQQKSQYVSKFLSSLLTLTGKSTFRKESLVSGKMHLDALSSPFVCVKFSKRGYEYVGAFVFDHEKNHFPSPNDNTYGMLFLPLSGRAADAELGRPTIPTVNLGTRRKSDNSSAITSSRRGKSRPAGRSRMETVIGVQPRTYACRSMGGGEAKEAAPTVAPLLNDDAPANLEPAEIEPSTLSE